MPVNVTGFLEAMRGKISDITSEEPETRGAVFTRTLREHTLVVDGEERTVEAHTHEEHEGRLVFYRHRYPTLTQVGGQIIAEGWEKEEVKGFGAESVTNWDTEPIEDQKTIVEVEYFDKGTYSEIIDTEVVAELGDAPDDI